MRVLYDHQIFSYQKYGGISKYFSELYREFSEMNDVEIQLGLKENVNYYLNELLKNTDLDIKNTDVDSLARKYFIYKRNQKRSVKLLTQNNYDILHSTFYDPYTIQNNNKAHVITVHDMTPELCREYYKGTLYSYFISRKWIQGKKELIEKADRVIAVSENTKKDMIEFYDVNEEKIEVIHHGCNRLPVPGKRLIDEPYILYIGLRDKYKNFKSFAKALNPILQKEKIKALCIGGGKFTKSEKFFLSEEGLENYFVQMSVDDKGLASAYKNALCFIFPSRYEGFGMPVLEAFSLECPVILSNASCFPEIAGDAAVYFDPTDEDSIMNNIKQTIYDTELQASLKIKGLERGKQFTWEKTARQTLDIYKGILDKNA